MRFLHLRRLIFSVSIAQLRKKRPATGFDIPIGCLKIVGVPRVRHIARRGAVHDMQVIIENTIMPSLKLLAEGQRTLLETMAPKTRVEELEDDMQLLKAVVRSQSERIDALEKRLA